MQPYGFTHADERLLIAHRLVVAVLDHYVVGTALNNRGGRDQGEPRLLLQLLDVERARSCTWWT